MNQKPLSTQDQEKCTIIEDIFRVMKASIVMHPAYEATVNDPVDEFYKMLDLTIEQLEVQLVIMSAELKMHMKKSHRAHIKDLTIFTSDFRYKANLLTTKLSRN